MSTTSSLSNPSPLTRRLGCGRGLRGLVALALAAVLAASIAQIAVARAAALPDGAVLRLRGETVTVDQFDRRVQVMEAVYGVTPPTTAAERRDFDRDVAKALAVSMILENAAAEQGIVVADKTAQDKLDQVIASSPGGREAFVAELGGNGVSEADVLAEIRRASLGVQLFDKVTAAVDEPSAKEVAGYYAAHREDMAEPEKRTLRNLVVADKATAARLLAKLRGGAAFASLARRNSLDQSTRREGGALGELSRDQLEDGYGSAAFAVGAGSYFGPVQTQYGWNVGQVVSITKAVPRSLPQVRDQLAAEMLLSAQLGEWKSWLAERIRDADVEYARDYRPEDPDAPPQDLGLS